MLDELHSSEYGSLDERSLSDLEEMTMDMLMDPGSMEGGLLLKTNHVAEPAARPHGEDGLQTAFEFDEVIDGLDVEAFFFALGTGCTTGIPRCAPAATLPGVCSHLKYSLRRGTCTAHLNGCHLCGYPGSRSQRRHGRPRRASRPHHLSFRRSTLAVPGTDICKQPTPGWARSLQQHVR